MQSQDASCAPLKATGHSMRTASPIGQVEQDNIGFLAYPIKDDFTTIWRYIEIADDKTATESGELPLAAGLEIDGPEFLMRDVPAYRPLKRLNAARPASE